MFRRTAVAFCGSLNACTRVDADAPPSIPFFWMASRTGGTSLSCLSFSRRAGNVGVTELYFR